MSIGILIPLCASLGFIVLVVVMLIVGVHYGSIENQKELDRKRTIDTPDKHRAEAKRLLAKASIQTNSDSRDYYAKEADVHLKLSEL